MVGSYVSDTVYYNSDCHSCKNAVLVSFAGSSLRSIAEEISPDELPPFFIVKPTTDEHPFHVTQHGFIR